MRAFVILAASCVAACGAGAAATRSAPPAPTASETPTPTEAPPATLAPTATEAPTASATEAAPTPAPPAKPAQGLVAVNDVLAPKEFDPNPILKSLRPKLTDCYKTALATSPSLHGKIKTRVVVFENGKVDHVEDAGKSTLSDPSLQQCVFDVLQAAQFPKPGGTATISFTLFFH